MCIFFRKNLIKDIKKFFNFNVHIIFMDSYRYLYSVSFLYVEEII